MRVLGTSIEYDTITRGERLGAFWLELAHKKVARILKTNTDREFALYSFQTKDYFMVVWDDWLKTFRISMNGQRIPPESDTYYSVHKLLTKVLVPFSRNTRRKMLDFEKISLVQKKEIKRIYEDYAHGRTRH